MLPFKVERQDGFAVLRDDLLPGGTKRRALAPLCKNLPHTNFVYAGTLMGHGALALAHAARDCGKSAHIYLAGRDANHSMIAQLEEAGAHISFLPPMPVYDLAAQAQRDFENTADSFFFPPGFALSAFEDALVHAISALDASAYSEVWACAVTGTFGRALARAYPTLPRRIVRVVKADLGFAHHTSYQAPEKYHRGARLLPPYPSCPHTDAKIWQFAVQHALPGALIWNVAG